MKYIRCLLADDSATIAFESTQERKDFETRALTGIALANATSIRDFDIEGARHFVNIYDSNYYSSLNKYEVHYDLNLRSTNKQYTIANFIRIGLGDNVSIVRNPRIDIFLRPQIDAATTKELAQLIADKSAPNLQFIIQGTYFSREDEHYRPFLNELFKVIYSDPSIARKINLKIEEKHLNREFQESLIRTRYQLNDKTIKGINAFKQLWQTRQSLLKNQTF